MGLRCSNSHNAGAHLKLILLRIPEFASISSIKRAGGARQPRFLRLDVKSRPLDSGISGPMQQAIGQTLAYTATTAATRNPALMLAGTATSVLFGLQRRISGGILAPALSHLTWSLLMLRYLPPLFPAPRRPEITRD